MRRFCHRHLPLIFSFCLIATSSYVLFDLLDIDGSNFKEHVQVLGFEAVMPACSGEIRAPATNHPAPWREFSRGLLVTASRHTSLAPRLVCPSIPRYLTVRICKTIQRGSSSSARGSDPARRSL